MNKSQISLLEAFGIQYDINDVIPIPIKIITPPEEPCEYEYWDWGDHVLQNNEPGTLHPFAVEYQHHEELKLHKIHRYSRTDRFKFTLFQLLGSSGYVPHEIKLLVKKQLGRKTRKSKIWNQVRAILKKQGLRRYYNRIPQIIRFVAKLNPKGIDKEFVIDNILNDFKCLHYKWNHGLGESLNRKYFPNLRFIALKLMNKHGITFPYNIPLVRTLRKKKYLNTLYEKFIL